MNTSSIDRFLRATRTARDYNSKEIRLSLAEAQELAFSLAELLVRDQTLLTQIIQLQAELAKKTDQSDGSTINLSGGSF